MLRVRTHFAYFGLGCLLVAAVGCPSVAPAPQLAVTAAAFTFPAAQSSDTLNISNIGGGTLTWSIGPTPSWLTVSPTSGSVTPEGLSTVTLTVDRTGLAQGSYQGQFTVSSNGGEQVVAVTLTVVGPPTPVLNATPAALDYGLTDTVRTITIQNTGNGTLNWTASSDQSWLTLSPSSGATTTTPASVTATADRTSLTPGTHTATISVSSDGGSASISVTLTVAGPTPVLSVLPGSLDFGTQGTTSTLTITNTGTGTLNWNASENLSWLSLSSSSGSVTTTPVTITVTMDRTGLAPGAFSGAISFTSDGGTATIPVQATVAAPQLVVTPDALNFGPNMTLKLLAISDGGAGSVNWSIDTSGFPTWLSISSASPTSGSVTNSAQGVVVMVDRTGLATGDYSHTITVTSDAGNAAVPVTMSVAVTPVLTVDTGGVVTSDGTPMVPVGDQNTTATFGIRNTGTGSLDWSIQGIDDSNKVVPLPSWLTIAPVAGSATNQTDTVTVTVQRTGLAAGPYTQNVLISSNGGNVKAEISMVVPPQASIGTDINQIDLGTNSSVAQFNVANYGDPGTVLNYVISSNKVWLYDSPSKGTSTGVATPPPYKDYQTVNVAIDRGSLESVGSTGTFTITAVDNTGAVISDIAPKTVTVSVEAAPLSFEQAIARTRIPSLVRFTFIMRDFRNDAIVTTPAALAKAFSIVENGVPLDLNETNQFVTSGANLRTNLAVVLDYSGSMFNAVQGLGLPGADQLQAAYEAALSGPGGFLESLPASNQIALMEFHDRNQPTDVVQGFTSDRTTLETALQGINVQDHGATELLPMVDEATNLLVAADQPLLAFDGADVRAVVLISDGRLTTPPGSLQDTITAAKDNHVRIFTIGWGKNVDSEPLAELALSTGGHFYPTLGDANGNPKLTELNQKLQTLVSDLSAQMVLTYVTLNESQKASVKVNAQVNNPPQGLLQGSFAQDLQYDTIVGDVRMGQISMVSSGVTGGAATVTVRTDYAPRNVNEFRFTLASSETFTVSLTSAANGGIASNWTLSNLGSGVYTLTAPAGTVLPYGGFGDLLTVTFPSVSATPFTLDLGVDNTIYASDPDPKFFLYPDSITVGATGSLAPSFPTASVTPTALDFGTGANTLTLAVRNIGGSYPYGVTPSDVELDWAIGSVPSFVVASPKSGSRNTTIGSDTVTLTADRSIATGSHSGTLVLTYTGNTLGIANTISVPVTLQVASPALAVDTNTLDFGAADTSLTLTVSNSGQSTLDWSVATTGFPAWLKVDSSSGTVVAGQSSTLTLTVNRSGLATGTYTYTFSVTSTNGGGPQLVTVNMSV